MTDERIEKLKEELDAIDTAQRERAKTKAKQIRLRSLLMAGGFVTVAVIAGLLVFSGNKDDASPAKQRIQHTTPQQAARQIDETPIAPVANNQQSGDKHSSDNAHVVSDVAQNSNNDTNAPNPSPESDESASNDAEKILTSAKARIQDEEKAREEERIKTAEQEGASVIAKLSSATDPTGKSSYRSATQSPQDRENFLRMQIARLFSAGGNIGNTATEQLGISAPTDNYLTDIIATPEPTATNTYIAGLANNQANSANGGHDGQSAASAVDNTQPLPPLGIKLLPGDEITAMTLMSINTDKPSPVTAIIQDPESKLNGAKLLGDFNKTNDAVQILFKTLVFKGRTANVNIVALDPATRNANIADDVDRHWWKWIAFSAAALADGYLAAVTTTTTTQNPDGSQVTTNQGLSDAGDRNRAALANVGRQMLAPARSALTIPNTIKVNEYRTITLLVMSEVNL